MKEPLAVLVLELALYVGAAPLPLRGQSATAQALAPQTTTAKQPAFDVASIRQSKPGGQPNSNFPLGPGDVYMPNGGLFSATSFPLITYILFAYKLQGNQIQSLQPQLPEWATTQRFDIQARAEGNPGKDQMRLLMRSLLADRFKLAVHTETREAPVLAFVLIKPGVTGPRLLPHPADSPCPTNAPPAPAPGSANTPAPPLTDNAGFPTFCNGIFALP